MAPGETPYRFEDVSGYHVVTLLPQLNDAPWSDIEKVGTDILQRLEAINAKGFLVDLSPLDYMGSAMVALVVRIFKTLRQRNKQMVVVNTHEMVYEVLKLAGLTDVWTIVNTREEGFKALGRAGGGRVGSAASGQSAALAVVAIVAAIGAAFGYFAGSGSPPMLDPMLAGGITVVFSLIGVVLGIMAVLQQANATRVLGIVVLLICAAAGFSSASAFLSQSPASPAVESKSDSSTSEKGEAEGAAKEDSAKTTESADA